MYRYHIYEQLKKFASADKNFHVPGHKGKGEFAKMFPAAKFDVTELSYSDNLFCPQAVIAAAQKDLAEITGAEKSYILTDGSTCGIFSMLYVLKKRGGKVIIPRNSHQSVWNACKILGLEPLPVRGKICEGVLLPPDCGEVERALDGADDIAGMLALSPDYYGNIAPIEEYKQILGRRGKLLCVDGAHGAHLFNEGENGAYSGRYADMRVDGAHKSLSVLTQGALLSVYAAPLIADAEEALSVFRTTSPSYPIMASVEYGFKYLSNNPQAYFNAKAAAEEYKNNAKELCFYPSEDWTKLVWDLKPAGICADKALCELEKAGIYAELSDGRYIIFYLSPSTNASSLKKLLKAQKQVISLAKLADTYFERSALPETLRVCGYLAAAAAPCEAVELSAAEGRVCAVNAGVTPPCIPVICAGERISREVIQVLTNAKNTFGLTDGKVWAVKQ